MADAQEEPAPPPKEKKKKKSSSVKSNKSATEEAPQLSAVAAAGEEQQPPSDQPAPAEPPSGEAQPPELEPPPADAPQECEPGQEAGAEEPPAPPAEAPAAAPAPVVEQPPQQPQMTAKQRRQEEAALAKENKYREMAEGFMLVDFNKDGQIDKGDLQMTISALGCTNITDEELDGMLGEVASPLDVDVFVGIISSKAMELDPEEILVQALSSWDMDDSGYIPYERIKRALMEWGDIFTEDEVTNALEDAPVYQESQGPMIDYVEFCKIITGNPTKNY